MVNVTIRDATPDDIEHVAVNMREADVNELRAAGHDEPAQALREAYKVTDWTRCALVDGVPAVIWGVSQTDSHDIGSPWMLATDGIRKIKHEFVAGCGDEIQRMRQGYKLLFNQVHKDNAVSIRWLGRLGFSIDSKLSGPGGQFLNFWMGGANV